MLSLAGRRPKDAMAQRHKDSSRPINPIDPANGLNFVNATNAELDKPVTL